MSNKTLRFATLVLVIALIAPAPVLTAQSNGQAEVLMREAMHAEVSDGDLEHAIELYRTIVEDYGDVRPVAAQALLRIGMSYEKLGMQEAQAAYERLLREYGDQRELVAEAGGRLTAMGVSTIPSSDVPPPSTDAANGSVVVASGAPLFPLSISPNGDKLAFWDFEGGQNISVYDVGTGEARQVTDSDWVTPEGSSAFFDAPAAWSPDGTRIAVTKGLADDDEFAYELRVFDLEGRSTSVYRNGGQPSTSTEADNSPGVWASDWLPDGSGIVGVLQRSDLTYTLGVFSTIERSFTPIRSFQWDFVPYFNQPKVSPDGRFIVFVEGKQDANDVHIVAVDGSDSSLVTAHPADDKNPLWSPDGRHLVWLSRRLGNYGLWGVAVENGHPAGEPFLIQSGMENITLFDWIEDGLVYSKDGTLQDAYTIRVDAETGEALGEPEHLPYPYTGATEWARFSPDGSRIAFVHERREVVVVSGDGSDPREFPLPSGGYPRDFQWLPDGSAVSFLKPDDREVPSLFKLDVETGDLRKWPAPPSVFPAQFAWTGRGDSVYYIGHSGPLDQGGALEIREYDLAGGEERLLFSFTDAEAAELNSEPIWTVRRPRTSPDLGSVAFHTNTSGIGSRRSTWVLDVATRQVRRVSARVRDESSVGTGPISWARDGRFISWGVVTIDVETGEAQRFTGLGPERFSFVDPDATIRSRHWSPDGKRVLFTVRSISPEVWLLRHVIPAVEGTQGRR